MQSPRASSRSFIRRAFDSVLQRSVKQLGRLVPLSPAVKERVAAKVTRDILIQPGTSPNGLIASKLGEPIVPLSWSASSMRCPYANLGDALSPVLVSALSGIPCVHHHFGTPKERLAAVGTIAHGFKNGIVHVWGTGIDKAKNPIDREIPRYLRPPDTEFRVHAMRGPFSAQVFRNEGIEVPEIYGDPVWFLPAIVPPAPEKRYELGVIVHISELAELTDVSGVKPEFLRYSVPESLSADIRIINTLTPPTLEALEQKIAEITACKRIISTSLHGLVIAETYGIPCAYFRPEGEGIAHVQLADEQEYVDHRMRDFYSGAGVQQLFVYSRHRHLETDWEGVIAAVDQYWTPLTWDPSRFLEAFPLPLAFDPLHRRGAVDRSVLERLKL